VVVSGEFMKKISKNFKIILQTFSFYIQSAYKIVFKF
jgi:hypothetical protein